MVFVDTVPCQLAQSNFYLLYSRFDIQERLFFSLADELIRTRRLPGIITGISLMINALF
jgi:hypothetical protein